MTVEEFLERCKTDPVVRAEAVEFAKAGDFSTPSLLAFTKKYDIKVRLRDIPHYMAEARKYGIIK